MSNTYYDLKQEKTERPGREIKLKGKELYPNKNISCKIGTVDDKNAPKTVYISISFWVDIKNKNLEEIRFGERISKDFSRELNKIYREEIKNNLNNNKYFPFAEENIYVCDFPVNLAYNNKKSFVCIELNLHTINCLESTIEKVPLKNKNSQELLDELIKIYKVFADSDLLQGKLGFTIHKSKKG